MSSFIDDPEAQAAYRERFGTPEPVDEGGFYADPAAETAYEQSGFRETPSVTFGDQQTYAEILAERRPQAAPGFPEGAVFSEPSERLSRLSARVRGGGDFNLSGSDPFLSNE